MYKAFYLDLSGRRALVLGAGSVGARKAHYLAQAGARVTVVGEKASPQARELEERGVIRLEKRRLEPGSGEARSLIDESDFLVIATSDDELNRWSASHALRSGKWVNNAVNAGRGNVIIPFTRELLGGRVHLAATSMGASGIAVRRLLDHVVKCLTDSEEAAMLERLFDALALLKKVARECVGDAGRRIALYFYVSDHPVLTEALKEGSDPRPALSRIAREVLRERESQCIEKGLASGSALNQVAPQQV